MSVPRPTQVIPLLEYAILLFPSPTATHLVPFHATPRPETEKMFLLDSCVPDISLKVVAPVHVSPSLE